jgi:hypothetical protein
MKHLSFLAVIVWLFLPAAALAQSQQTTDVDWQRLCTQQIGLLDFRCGSNLCRNTMSAFSPLCAP